MLSDYNPWADGRINDPERDATRPPTAWTDGLTNNYLDRPVTLGRDIMPVMRNALGIPQRPTPNQIAEIRGMDPANVPATQGQRAGALLIDGLVYGVVLTVLVAVMTALGISEGGIALFSASILMTPLGFYAYRTLTEGVLEGSPGKHIMGLRVVGPNNLPISTGQAAKRNLWHLLMMFPPAWGIAALVMSANGGTDAIKQNQADRWAQTQVVHKKPQEELARRNMRRAELGR
ncbi:RDD family protein [Corynebacterium ulceribovis]|uniref:RDD family protein n=1 Tax=Corynebacterium ulceribovis TaxID=487732 RepID=UPI0003706909|nr:RDD family protein [Corynebacterium ulceribovis]